MTDPADPPAARVSVIEGANVLDADFIEQRSDLIPLPHVEPAVHFRIGGSSTLIAPPVDLDVVARVIRQYGDLQPVLDAYVSGLVGHGWLVVPDRRDDDETVAAATDWLDSLPEEDELGLADLLGETVRARESGNAYWEMRRDRDGRVVKVGLIDYRRVRLTDREAVDTDVTMTTVRGTVVRTVSRFRRYCVLDSGGRQTWFRQYGDPRPMSPTTGLPPTDRLFDSYSEGAHELLHWRLPGAGGAYGVPRWSGLLVAMIAAVESDTLNLRTIRTMDVPPSIVFLDGAMTAQSAAALAKWKELQATGRTLGAMLWIELVGNDMISGARPTAKIERLRGEQRTDESWSELRNSTRARVRGAYRIPPIVIGDEGAYTKATSESARRSVEQYVFAPDRRPIERRMTALLREHGYAARFVLRTPDVSDPDTVVAMLTRLVASGGDTPQIVRDIFRHVTGIEIDDGFGADVRPDAPWSGQLAERQSGRETSAPAARADVLELPAAAAVALVDGRAPGVVTRDRIELRGRWSVGAAGVVLGEVELGAPRPATRAELDAAGAPADAEGWAADVRERSDRGAGASYDRAVVAVGG